MPLYCYLQTCNTRYHLRYITSNNLRTYSSIPGATNRTSVRGYSVLTVHDHWHVEILKVKSNMQLMYILIYFLINAAFRFLTF